MRVSTKFVRVAAALATAYAATAMAQGGAPGGPPPKPKSGAVVDAGPRGQMAVPVRPAHRLEQMKKALNLQPSQMPAWNAYEAAARAHAETQGRLREEMRNTQGDAGKAAEIRKQMDEQRTKAAKEIDPLREALVATFSDEQKTTFERMRPSRGPVAAEQAPAAPR